MIQISHMQRESEGEEMAVISTEKNGKYRHRGFTEHCASMLSGLWKNRYRVLAAVIAVMAVFSLVSARKSEKRAEAVLTLRYENAYEGLTPNGTRFNIYELLSDKVLEEAVERAGLTGEVSASDLLGSLTVRPSGSQSANNMYIVTEYSVTLKDDCLPSRVSAESMLTLLMETYKEYFLDNYGTDDSVLYMDWSDAEEWEYLEFANIMDVRVNNLITYLNNLRSESGMTQYRISGETFTSLSESVSEFRDIYLDKYVSFVRANNLFRDAAAYSEKLQYRRFLAEQDRMSSQDRYTVYQDALKMYDESMITFVMVPFYDSANGLYMARTSIGMDSLTETSKEYAEKLETDSKTISEFERDLQSTASAEWSSEEKRQQAEKMIDEIRRHLDGLIERIRSAVRDYENYRSTDSIQYAITEPGFAKVYDLKWTLAAGCCALLLIAAWFAFREEILQAAGKVRNGK